CHVSLSGPAVAGRRRFDHRRISRADGSAGFGSCDSGGVDSEDHAAAGGDAVASGAWGGEQARRGATTELVCPAGAGIKRGPHVECAGPDDSRTRRVNAAAKCYLSSEDFSGFFDVSPVALPPDLRASFSSTFFSSPLLISMSSVARPTPRCWAMMVNLPTG